VVLDNLVVVGLHELAPLLLALGGLGGVEVENVDLDVRELLAELLVDLIVAPRESKRKLRRVVGATLDGVE
jgi:hypothetical protein